MEYDGLPQNMYRQVIAMLRRIHDEEGLAWRDMACIYPHPLFSRLLTMVISEQIPYTVLGERVPRDADVESVIAMLSLVLNPRDFQAFRRAAPVDQSPSRELSTPTAAAGIRKTALESDGDLVQAAESHMAGHRYDGRVYRDLRYVTEVWRELNGLAAPAARSRGRTADSDCGGDSLPLSTAEVRGRSHAADEQPPADRRSLAGSGRRPLSRSWAGFWTS